MTFLNQMTLGKLKAEIDLALEQGIHEDTAMSVMDTKGNIKEIYPDSFAYNPGFGTYIKIRK